MKIQKGDPGYITSRKRINLLWLLGFIVVGLIIFFVGYAITHVRANIFTVVAVLLVLPAAKRVVALVVLLPKKSIDKDRYQAMRDITEPGILYTDYVFTSTEKIMHLDFMLIKNNNVMAVPAASKQDIPYMKEYLKECVHKVAPDYHVRCFDTDEAMANAVRKLTTAEADADKEEELRKYLDTLAM